ncbi:MAG: glycosyltransferase, partial [Acidimicrobiia bacterium]|nr:glycosyltransferase [Acidimicrobiia bacterium]
VKSARVGVVVLHPLPNYIPALPIKMYEYMAAGIPVVASSGTLWGDTIKELRCGLVVDPLDPQAIADAIDSLLADATTAAAMGARGRAAVEKDFSWEAQGAELVGLYERIAPRDVAG